VEEYAQTTESAPPVRSDPFAPDADIVATRLPSDLAASPFCDQSILDETNSMQAADIAAETGCDAQSNAGLTFSQSFRASREVSLIETILPVPRAIPDRPLVADKPEPSIIAEPVMALEQAQEIQSALARVAQVRRALFGTAGSPHRSAGVCPD
jgi:hypothetical protein